ncbi:peritrophin-44-like isoform X1 [Scylla paramamosain]|uniref:peritrophin-44-like isoform X1 n=1 Tax=Scylla paramamosain TaxID=85552 RepID=UPI00308279F9
MLWITSLLLLLSLQTISATLLEELEDVEWIELGLDSRTGTPPPPGECDPDCSSPGKDGKVENPRDCHQFYICVGGEPNGPLDCPDGTYFDTNSSDCVPNGSEECKPTCGGGGGAGGDCTYKCDDSTAYRADRYDCSTYYTCPNDGVMHCGQETPFFDGETCQTEEKKCCHCNPYCYTGDENKKVLDPTDCTKYYFCLEANKVPEYSGRCSSGNFDPFSQECSLTVPCLTLCTNVVKPDGCIDVFTCREVGYFPRCVDKCTQEYYHCSAGDIGSVVAADTCPGENVFDPNESSCVKPSQCSIK